eukprot:5421874-Amphidinium_carterae.1
MQTPICACEYCGTSGGVGGSWMNHDTHLRGTPQDRARWPTKCPLKGGAQKDSIAPGPLQRPSSNFCQ